MTPPIPITTLLLSPLEYPKAWQQHYERLKTSCHYFEIKFPFLTIEEFKARLEKQMETLSQPTIYRLEIHESGIEFHQRSNLKNEPLKLKTVLYIREHNQYKTFDYQAEEEILKEVEAEGFNEILRVTSDNLFSETAYRNIVFEINHQHWVTPEPTISQCLPGIELQRVIHQAEQNNIKINCQICPLSWLENNQITAAFTTNSVRGIQPVIKINSILLNPQAVKDLISKIIIR